MIITAVNAQGDDNILPLRVIVDSRLLPWRPKRN
jgi:hypothetical protein